MSVEPLLKVLADGRFHSGEALGQALGVSRAAIWKQLKKLEALGIDLYSVKGRGYRIPDGLDLLSVAAIREPLQPRVAAQLGDISLSLSTLSTSADAMAATASLAAETHGRLFVAEQQTAGRGRRGRSWVSPFARNLYFSLCWRFNGGAAALEGLSLVVGLAVYRALGDCGVDGLALKWPNDLLRDDRKLAGILLEMSGDADGICQVVIGVGINVDMTPQEAASIDQPWSDLSDRQPRRSRAQLLAAVLNRLVPMVQRFSQRGFEPFQRDWNEANAHQGVDVSLTTPRHRFDGVCRGVNQSGALLLETANGVELFHGGEVSLRSADDS